MIKQTGPEHQREHTILLILLALFLFASPFTMLWASNHSPWFLPYLLWLFIILIGAWLSHHHSRHDL
ncbi:MAG: hypothetical protein ABW162_08595 [Candidatus Sedimenticola sp. PURPLELP]